MNNTDRDRAIETLLRSRRADESGSACIDAESLAAWVDGGLPADARARVEEHAADCARCQALLASMARTAPELEDRPWWRSAMAKWAVPIAAVATALVVWVAVERDSDWLPSSQRAVTETGKTANAPAAETGKTANAPAAPVAGPREAVPSPALPGNSVSRVTPRAEDTSRKERKQAGESAQQSHPPAAVGGIAGGRIDSIRPQGQADAAAVAGGQAPTAPHAEPVPSPPPPAAPLPPPASTPESPAQSPAQLKRTPQGAAETVTVTDATASRLAAREFADGIGPGTREITSPNPNYRWRIVLPGSIQRSTDGGRTWAVVDPVAATSGAAAAPAILTAGASPAPDVCWIVGRNGLVLLSTDGATWHRRPIPEALDLTSVRATDATHAIVTTATGRQFATADGGVTWNVN